MDTIDALSTTGMPLHERAGWRPALVLAALALAGFGFLYALASATLGYALFPHQARGSIVVADGKPVASELVAQPFAAARYFHPRPSAAGYDPIAAAGSNQARTNPEFVARLARARSDIAVRDGIAPVQVAGDLATQSGSGLDPDISVAAAQQQVARIARVRGIEEARVHELLVQAATPPQFGFLGPARVNVVRVNLALDAMERRR